ncbi:MAG: OsmC family protein [Bacteroidetes bacterium]|nr:OsmC family protein [Bacteroidota bacterium]
MKKVHRYNVSLQWTGNNGKGTSAYNVYSRNHTIIVNGKPEIVATSDPSFLGDIERYNPEELLVASISSCHLLWYLHLCSEAGVIVTAYTDRAIGTMRETEKGSGYFEEVVLYPHVFVSHTSMIDTANALHKKANEFCFIANSVNFPVRHQPTCEVC